MEFSGNPKRRGTNINKNEDDGEFDEEVFNADFINTTYDERVNQQQYSARGINQEDRDLGTRQRMFQKDVEKSTSTRKNIGEKNQDKQSPFNKKNFETDFMDIDDDDYSYNSSKQPKNFENKRISADQTNDRTYSLGANLNRSTSRNASDYFHNQRFKEAQNAKNISGGGLSDKKSNDQRFASELFMEENSTGSNVNRQRPSADPDNISGSGTRRGPGMDDKKSIHPMKKNSVTEEEFNELINTPIKPVRTQVKKYNIYNDDDDDVDDDNEDDNEDDNDYDNDYDYNDDDNIDYDDGDLRNKNDDNRKNDSLFSRLKQNDLVDDSGLDDFQYSQHDLVDGSHSRRNNNNRTFGYGLPNSQRNDPLEFMKSNEGYETRINPNNNRQNNESLGFGMNRNEGYETRVNSNNNRQSNDPFESYGTRVNPNNNRQSNDPLGFEGYEQYSQRNNNKQNRGFEYTEQPYDKRSSTQSYQGSREFTPGEFDKNNKFGADGDRNNKFGADGDRNNKFGAEGDRNNKFGADDRNNKFGAEGDRNNKFGADGDRNNKYGADGDRNNKSGIDGGKNKFESQSSSGASGSRYNIIPTSVSNAIKGFINKDENEIKVIFHVHLPEGIDGYGQPMVLGDVKELGMWKKSNVKLTRQSATYWQSGPVTILTSNVGRDIHYKYALISGGLSGYLFEKIIFEGNSEIEDRILDTTRNDQFDIWNNSNELYNLRIAPNNIRDFAFVNYIYNSIKGNNLKDKVMEYQHLLKIHQDLTFRASDTKFILSHIDDRPRSREKKLFLCLLLGYFIPRQHPFYELSNQFPSELLLDALEGYKQESLPSDTRDQMYTAVMTLVQNNAFQMYFNWLKIFTVASEIDPDYTFIDRLGALKYDNNRLTRFIKEVKNIKPYINVNSEAYAKLAKWLIQLCHDMDSLLKLLSDVLLRNNTIDNNIFKCFIDRFQENISRNDAVALENHFKKLPKILRNNVSDVFRKHVLLLLKSPNSKWTDPNISAIQKLLRESNLKWRGDDVILSLELISRSNSFGLLNIFPELLDDWFGKDFSDTKKKIPDICVNWFTLLLTKLNTSEKNTSDGSNFIFSVFQQLERMHPLLGQRINVWRNLTSVAIKRVKGCSENQIFSATKLIAQIRRDEFKRMFLEIVKEVLNKSIQINDRLIDKIFLICNCNNKTKPLQVPNSSSEYILCHIMSRLPGQSTISNPSEYYLYVLKESKFWGIILRATGSVDTLNSTPYVKRAKTSINELGVLLLKKTIDIKLLQQLLKYPDRVLFDHFDAAVAKKKTLADVIVSQSEIANLRKLCDYFQRQFDILFKFYGIYCSAATDVNVYLQQMQNSDRVNLRQVVTSDYWAFHEKILFSARSCYKFNQSQTFLNIFEDCFQKDANTTNVEYIAQKLIPIVFEKYDDLCKQFKQWEKLKCSDASLLWRNVTDVRAELDLMEGYNHKSEKFVKSLDYLAKIPHWIERLEQLDQVAGIFNVPRDKEDWLLKSIRILRDGSTELGQINSFFVFLDKNLSHVDENCWGLIKELSNAENFMEFLKKIADHDITNLINGVDDHSDEKLIQEDTVSSLIQVKRFFSVMNNNKMETVSDVLEVLINIIKKNPTLAEKIALCNSNNKALQNMYDNISNRGEVTKEKIKNAVTNGIYTFERDEKGDKCLVTLEYTSKNKMTFNLNEILDLRGRALLIAKPKTTVRVNESDIMNDNEMEISRNIMDEFVAQVDVAQEIYNTVSVLIQLGHFVYRKFEKKLRGTEEMKKYFKALKDELEGWQDIVDRAQEQCYYLTFFPSRHILAFYDYFTSEELDKENEEECKKLIRFVNSKAKLPSRENVKGISNKSKDYFEILCKIGNELERIFKDASKQTRELKVDAKSDVVTKGKLFVAACTNKTLVSNIIMSLYANHGSYPEPWQLLICTSSTTTEELSIFIKRSFFASNNGYENHLFCIANLELLDFELQYNLVNQIRSMRELHDQEKDYLLALICCREAGTHHHILDQFSTDVHATNGLSTETMRGIYQELCPNVTRVSSDLSGQGKTEFIKEESFSKEKFPRSFLISDGMDFGRLVRQFKECKLRPVESLHINIVSSNYPEDVNMFLFELLTLGIVSTHVDIACLPPSETPTYIFIEIASTTEQRLLNSLPMAGYLIPKHLTWDIKNLKISQVISSPIQVACNYLDSYDRGEIDTKEILFRTNNAIKNPLPVERCQNLIEKYFFNKNSGGISSFRFVEIFVNVLADQLVRLSSSQFFTVENLKLMVKENNIRSLIVGTLMDVSKDFATRSIKTKAAQLLESTKAAQLESTKTAQLESMTDDDEENARLGTIAQWDDSNHLMVFFNSQTPDTISALYRDRTLVPDNVKDLLRSQVAGNGDKSKWELGDYNTMSANALLVKLECLARNSVEKLDLSEYALSGDNLIKMALILLRARANIPVIVCGEAGCGKTSLIAYLANMVEVQFKVLNLHAGINEEIIMTFMDDALKEAKIGEIWLFFDEINTCNHIGLLADLISHRMLNGRPIHPSIRLFSACNPYRLRTRTQSDAGLTNKVKKYEEQSNLVYQVKPLPDQILDYVWDYGILKPKDEYKYIQIMVEKELKKLALPVFSELLFASQEFIREVEEPYSVSLRDVKRAITLVKFFYNSLHNRPALKNGHKYPPPGNPTALTRSYILALGLCYHSRLYEQSLRKKYRNKMGKVLQSHKAFVGEDMFARVIREEQEDYIDRMQCPPNTAKNEALLENVLVMIVCILTRIPLFLIGAPGSSKSLATRLISSNLRGIDSNDRFFRLLPRVYLIPHQGSSSSTSDGIIKVFEKANKYQETNSKQFPVISVVLLDEVGLAETSPYNPLKVLHSLLEPSYPAKGPTVSVIGISNWRLDNSKSSRALLVQRPQFDLDDLVDTATRLLSTKVIGSGQRAALELLAKAYSDYEQNGQDFPNFHGLRDYYSLVKRLSIDEMSPENIQMALARNFGGTENNAKLCNIYFGDVLKTFNHHNPWFYEPIPIEQLIDSNLDERDTRHLMIIGKSDSIVDLLTYQLRRKNLEPVVILGSQFPDDQGDYSYSVLNRIMMCVEEGRPLILTDLEIIYGSLYDLWNQNYIVVGNEANAKYFTRVALGAYANPMLFVSPNFKCILVMDEKKLVSADPPLLNRFEKQKMSINDVLSERQKGLVVNLGEWARQMSTLTGVSSSSNNEFTQKDLFIGFNKDETLQSLIIDVMKNNPEVEDEEILDKCKKRLVAIASSDGILRAEQSTLERDEVDRWKEVYFRQQHHDSLYDYFENLLLDDQEKSGHLVIVNTFSNINTDVKYCLQEHLRCQVDKLSTFKTEAQLSNRIKHFWLESTDNLLILQCNVATVNAGCMKLAKFIIEQFRSDFIAKKDQMEHDMPTKHACIILHIHRDQESTLASFNFMCGWKQVTIENLLKSDIPLYGLLNGSLSDVINSTYPFERILEEELLWCLLCIKYPSSYKTVDHIKILSEKILECSNLVECLKVKTLEWIGGNSTNDWQYKVASNKQNLYPYASFSAALQVYIRTLVRQPIAKILCALERLSATKTLFYVDRTEHEELLLEFWQETCMDSKIVKIEDIPNPKPDGYIMPEGSLYDLKFPFSFYFMKQIDNFRRYYEEELTVLQQDDDKVDDITNELHDYEIEKHLKVFKDNILTSVPQLKSKSFELVPELYFKDFVTVIAESDSGNVNPKMLASILKLLIGANKVTQPIFLHTYWWKNSNEVLAQLQLAQMDPEIIQNIEGQDDVIAEEGLEKHIIKEIVKMMLQNICESYDDAVNVHLNRWQHDVTKILFLSNKITRARNSPGLQLLRIVNDLVATKTIPLNSIREIVQLGLNSNNQEVLSEEFVYAILEKLDMLKQDEKNLIAKRSFIMRCLVLIPIESDVRLSLYKKLFSSEPFPLMGAIIERIFFEENSENENIFFTVITDAEGALEQSARLNTINQCFKDLDTNMATLCCDVIEQAFFMDCELEELDFGDALEVLRRQGTQPLQKIAAIALLKEFVRRFWDAFLQEDKNSPITCNIMDGELNSEELINQINDNMALNHPLIHSLKIYFLRDLRRRDFSIDDVRRFCEAQKQILPWLGTLNWEGVKENRLPFNPYCNLPEYDEAEKSFTTLYSISHKAPFQLFIQKIKQKDTLTARLSLMGLFFIRLHTLRASREWRHPEIHSADFLTKELAGMDNLPGLFKTIATKILSNEFPLLQINNSDISNTDLFLKSVIAHIIALHASIEPNSSQLAMYLHKLQDCQNFFILTCTPDIESLVLNLVAGEGVTKYACKCGMTYVVANCGFPMESSTCPSCKNTIGGEDHVAAAGNTKLGEKLNRVTVNDEAGYIGESANQTLNHFVRSLSPTSYRILHLIVHALIGASAPQPALSFLQKSNQTATNAENYCMDHIRTDWEVLKNLLNCKDETLALMFHSLISLMMENPPLPNQQIKTTAERENWEIEFHRNYIEPQIRNITDTAANYRMKLDAASTKVQKSNMIGSEIDQTLAMDKQYRSENLPSLWRTIGVINFDSFRAYYNSDLEGNTNNYPFLSVFFKHAEQLELLKHLLPIVKFVQILNSKLGYYLTRQQAREMTFRDFLEKESNGENREIFNSAFEDFKDGWNKVMPNVKRYQCHELPNDKPTIDSECQIVLGLMEQKDAGIFLCAILHYLTNLQNNFLQEVMEILPGTCRSLKFMDEPTFVRSAPEEGSTKPDTPNGYCLQSMRIDHARSGNIINFTWDDEILAYSQRNFAVAKGQDIVYDLTKIEAELANILVFGKVYIETQPESELYLETFPYHMELFQGCMRILSDIKNLIPQKPISIEQMNILGASGRFSPNASESTIDNAEEILSTLEILLCFVKRTAIGDGEKSIEDYAKQWIKLSSLIEHTGFSKFLNNDLRLKHLVALYEFFEEQVADRKIKYVHEKYKSLLSKDMEAAILKSVDFEQPTAAKELIPAEAFALALKRFILRFLTSENQKETEPLYIYLQESSLNFWPSTVPEERIDDLFPENLMVSNASAAYQFTMKNIEQTIKRRTNVRAPPPKINKSGPKKKAKKFSAYDAS